MEAQSQKNFIQQSLFGKGPHPPLRYAPKQYDHFFMIKMLGIRMHKPINGNEILSSISLIFV